MELFYDTQKPGQASLQTNTFEPFMYRHSIFQPSTLQDSFPDPQLDLFRPNQQLEIALQSAQLDYQNLLASHQKLKQDIRPLYEAQSQWESDRHTMTLQIESLSTSHSQLEKGNQRLERENHLELERTWKNRRLQLEREQGRFLNEKSEFLKENDRIIKNHDRVVKEKDRAVEENIRLVRENDRMMAEKDKMSSELRQLKDQLEIENERLKKVLREKEECRKEHEQLEKVSLLKEKFYQSLMDPKESNLAEKDNVLNELARLQNEVTSLIKDKKTMHQTLYTTFQLVTDIFTIDEKQSSGQYDFIYLPHRNESVSRQEVMEKLEILGVDLSVIAHIHFPMKHILALLIQTVDRLQVIEALSKYNVTPLQDVPDFFNSIDNKKNEQRVFKILDEIESLDLKLSIVKSFKNYQWITKSHYLYFLRKVYESGLKLN